MSNFFCVFCLSMICSVWMSYCLARGMLRACSKARQCACYTEYDHRFLHCLSACCLHGCSELGVAAHLLLLLWLSRQAGRLGVSGRPLVNGVLLAAAVLLLVLGLSPASVCVRGARPWGAAQRPPPESLSISTSSSSPPSSPPTSTTIITTWRNGHQPERRRSNNLQSHTQNVHGNGLSDTQEQLYATLSIMCQSGVY